VKTLYVTDRPAIGDARLEGILEKLQGAAGLVVQVREKTATDRKMLERSKSARAKLGPAVPVFVNRRLDVAIAAGAQGVHLPADGLPLARTRASAPRGLRIGISTHSPTEARRAIEEGADLVVVGPVFETPSKKPFGPPLGPEALAELPPLVSHRAEVFAIGGIDESHLDELARFSDRITGVAAVRLVQEAPDPRFVIERIASL
jgi:thiamine-phosphate pyrophosphorylase